EFTLLNEAGEELQTGLTTDENGTLLIEELKPGKYQLVETKAPFGYQLDETPIAFEIVFDQQETLQLTMENNYIPSTFELTKLGEYGQLLEGVVFELQDSEGKTLQEGLTTDGQGKLTIDDLDPGSYQLVETETIPGYDLDSTPIAFDIGLGQTEVSEASFENPLTPGSVELRKVGEEGEALEGAEFTLFNEADEELQTGLITDKDGKLLIENLKPGNYQLIETKAPFGYQLDGTPIAFEIVFNQQDTLQLTMENEQSTGTVELTKTGEDGKALEGVQFELQDEEGNTLQTGLETNSSGKLLVSNLKPGYYQFVESKSLPGYDLNMDPIEFEITFGQTEVTEVNAVNPLSTGAVELTKVGDAGNGLAGATFELQNEQGETLRNDLATDESGKLVIEDLKPGFYQLIENEAPFGYELDSTPIPFEIDFNQEEILSLTVENIMSTGSVELTKIDEETGETLAGAVFELQQEGKVLQEDLKTDENGKLFVENLKPGTYQFVETDAPHGYQIDRAPITFTIDLGQSETLAITTDNAIVKGDFELTKVDFDNQALPLAGVKFELQDAEGHTVRENLITGEDGKLLIKDLRPGEYLLKEIGPLKGYLAHAPVSFTIDRGQLEAKKIKITNTQIRSGVELLKVDSKDKESTLQGAEFMLKNEKGQVVAQNLITDENGMIIVDHLKPGVYYFTETKAPPAGYVLDNSPIKFTIELGQADRTKVEVLNQIKENGEGTNQASLPATATNIFNYMLFGGILVIGGNYHFRVLSP
ncbi:SpaA isopeptide-forming pilin-related protein, partial [Gracilibacillus sp. JCM 18860]|uniref:SpaA isopeptide-forming pilin-related protein n=1 Tax=Gracilibacillus sp. JCM 18860 TaxID=1306159 RepID=UPI000B298FF6